MELIELEALSSRAVFQCMVRWGRVPLVPGTRPWGPNWARYFEVYAHEFGHLLDLVPTIEEGIAAARAFAATAAEEARAAGGSLEYQYVAEMSLTAYVEDALLRRHDVDGVRSEAWAYALVELLCGRLGMPLALPLVRAQARSNAGLISAEDFDALVHGALEDPQLEERAWAVLVHLREGIASS